MEKSEKNVIYLVNLDEDKVIPLEEKIISAFADGMGNSIFKTADGIVHYKIKSSGKTGILGKINMAEFQEKLSTNYKYNIEFFLKENEF